MGRKVISTPDYMYELFCPNTLINDDANESGNCISRRLIFGKPFRADTATQILTYFIID